EQDFQEINSFALFMDHEAFFASYMRQKMEDRNVQPNSMSWQDQFADGGKGNQEEQPANALARREDMGARKRIIHTQTPVVHHSLPPATSSSQTRCSPIAVPGRCLRDDMGHRLSYPALRNRR